MRISQFRQKKNTARVLAAAVLAVGLGMAAIAHAEEPKFTFKPTENGLVILFGNRPVASYFHSDEKVHRPFYADVCTKDGFAVTRTYPPKPDEPADHADMHPGIWLAFGDLNGQDFWRNRGNVKHGRQLAEPMETEDGFRFATQNEYVVTLPEGEVPIARETCRHTWSQLAGGLLLTLDSEFESAIAGKPLVFGDQEEMGLGVRVATPLRVKDAGGEIRTSDGKQNEKEAWGQQARWCDYSGKVDSRQVGTTLLTHPENFRESWFHVRDYGLMVANPFGRSAFTKGEKSRVVVKPGEKLRLRFGVWIHSGKETSEQDLESTYQSYVKRASK